MLQVVGLTNYDMEMMAKDVISYRRKIRTMNDKGKAETKHSPAELNQIHVEMAKHAGIEICLNLKTGHATIDCNRYGVSEDRKNARNKNKG